MKKNHRRMPEILYVYILNLVCQVRLVRPLQRR